MLLEDLKCEHDFYPRGECIVGLSFMCLRCNKTYVLDTYRPVSYGFQMLLYHCPRMGWEDIYELIKLCLNEKNNKDYIEMIDLIEQWGSQAEWSSLWSKDQRQFRLEIKNISRYKHKKIHDNSKMRSKN